MRAILILTSLLMVAGCSTTPEDQKPAGVEDRSKPGAGKPGAQAQPVERPKVGAVDLTAGKKDPATGNALEPIEKLFVEIPSENLGTIMENLSGRKAQITNMNHVGNQVSVEALVPMRGLIGSPAIPGSWSMT